MFFIREDGVSHALLTAVLEPVQELSVGDRTILVGRHTTPRQEGSQELLLQHQTKVPKHFQEVVEVNLPYINSTFVSKVLIFRKLVK